MRRSRGPGSFVVAVACALAAALPAAATASPSPGRAGIVRPEVEAELAYYAALRDPGDEEAAALFRLALNDAERAVSAASATETASGIAGFKRIVFYDEWIGRVDSMSEPSPSREVLAERAPGYAAEMLALLRGGAVPTGFWRRLEEATGFEAKPALFTFWLGSEPRSPALLAALAGELWDPLLRAALFRAALDAEARPEGDPRLRAWLLQERLRALLDLGLPEPAVSELAAALEPVRELLLAGAAGPVELELAGLPVAGTLRDLRTDLAAAFALAGDLPRASELLGRTPVPEPAAESDPRLLHDPQVQGTRAVATRRGLLERLLAESGAGAAPPRGDDPFDLFLEVFLGRGLDHGWTVLQDLLLARLAEATGYPEIARHVLAGECRRLRGAGPGFELASLEPFGGLPFAARAEVSWLREELIRRRGEVEDRIAMLPAGPAWVRSAECSPLPAPPAFPPQLPPASNLEPLDGPSFTVGGERPKARRLEAGASGILPPQGLAPVAVFRAGDDVLLLALRPDQGPLQDYGYWIARSTDAGVSWQLPHQAGFHVGGPFEVLAGSQRNRLAGDRIELEVSVENEGERFGLPGLPRGGVALLSLSVSELLRDSDGDTLTDLEERRTYTDPRRRDTDRDGTDDGFDPLPLESLSGPRDPETARALAAAVERMISPWAPPSRARDRVPAGRRLPPQTTVLFVGEGLPLGPPTGQRRISVIPARHAGSGLVHEIELFVFDRHRARALVLWRESGRHGSVGSGRLLLAREAEGWRVVKGFHRGGCVIMEIVGE